MRSHHCPDTHSLVLCINALVECVDVLTGLLLELLKITVLGLQLCLQSLKFSLSVNALLGYGALLGRLSE